MAPKRKPESPSQPQRSEQKRQRHLSGSQARIDPTYGQLGAFPGLDAGPGDEPSDSISSEAIAYLRGVRSEARGIPTLLTAVAPAFPVLDELEDDNPHNSGYADARGYYEDGAYIATPVIGPMQPSGTTHTAPERLSAEKAYHVLLLRRFARQRAMVRRKPPPWAIETLQEQNMEDLRGTETSAWLRKLRFTDPTLTQLACMDGEQARHLIRLLTQHIMQRKLLFGGGRFWREGAERSAAEEGAMRVGLWAGALLAKVEELGTLGSEEVADVRELGKRAAAIVEEYMDQEPDSESTDGELADAEESEVEDSAMGRREKPNRHHAREIASSDENWGPERPPVNSRLPLGRTARAANNEQSEHSESHHRRNSSSSISDGEIDDVKFAGGTQGFFGAIDAMKSGILAKFDAFSALSAKARDGANSEQTAADPEPALVSTDVASATLDMILTIVGERFGQRDLLWARDVLWEAWLYQDSRVLRMLNCQEGFFADSVYATL